MARQLIFDLPVRPALGREDFFVSSANAVAVAAIEGWHNWPERKMVLVGELGSGKSHLAQVWSGLAGAEVLSAEELAGIDIPALAAGGGSLAVEDVNRVAGQAEPEEALFHLHNLLLAEGGTLLLTADTPPLQWPLTLADLASRMQATSVVMLERPDDDLLRAVLLKLFADRQLSVQPQIVDYLVTRMDRSLADAGKLVAEIDRAALSQSRAITRSLAASVLDKSGSTTA